MKKVIIGSQNPVKINAVKEGFQKMLPEKYFEFLGTSVPSDVSDQPMTNAETFRGAVNRAANAQEQHSDAEFWVGIEGGLETFDNELQAYAWVYILSKTQTGKARTGTFLLPPEIVKLINRGIELGEADDIVFRRKNSKQGNGAVGILTNDIISRTEYYREAVILALIPFINKDLF
ncbi:MAG: inosine/xanthosine triphosphatase [Fidelibacterota bacterium]